MGKSFGSFVTHETKTYVIISGLHVVNIVFRILYFFLGNIAFLVWRHG